MFEGLLYLMYHVHVQEGGLHYLLCIIQLAMKGVMKVSGGV